MNSNSISMGGSSSAQDQVMIIESYLSENFIFRRNVLSNNYEYKELGEKPMTDFAVLTKEVENSMTIELMKMGVSGNVASTVDKCIRSRETVDFNPIKDYLDNLPKWDGVDRLDPLFYQIPGINAEMVCFCQRWFLSCVAHWYGMDAEFGNQTVLLLIGAQGCGKSTFAQRLLPPHLRKYYLDHLNLGNKNDKEMALSDCLLVNIDEFDQVKASQQAELKHTISKATVNGRKIYGRTHQMRQRFASFIATTNNLHPLKDTTGSRRYVCVNIPNDHLIYNGAVLEYDQIYAQALHLLKEEKRIYWFTEEENKRIQHLNLRFYAEADFEEIVSNCVRKPKDGEEATPMSCMEILAIANKNFPGLDFSRKTQTLLGMTLNAMGVKKQKTRLGTIYEVVALDPAA